MFKALLIFACGLVALYSIDHARTDPSPFPYRFRWLWYVVAALGVLIGMANQAKVAVSFNDHARNVVSSVLMRNRKSVEKWMRPGLCFPEMREAVRAACKIPSETEDGQYRLPKLDEACSILLAEPPREGPKSAHEDVQRVRRLFFELKRQNLLEVVL